MLQQETIRNGELEDIQTKLEKQVYVIGQNGFTCMKQEFLRLIIDFFISYVNCYLISKISYYKKYSITL